MRGRSPVKKGVRKVGQKSKSMSPVKSAKKFSPDDPPASLGPHNNLHQDIFGAQTTREELHKNAR